MISRRLPPETLRRLYTCRHGEAWLYQGHDPGWSQRLGRLAALLQLPADARWPRGTPGSLFRGAAQGPGRASAGPLPRLLRAPGNGAVAPLRGSLPGARRPLGTAAALLARCGALPPRLHGRTVRVPGDLANRRLPLRLLSAAVGGAGRALGGGGLRGGGVARGRARYGARDRGR